MFYTVVDKMQAIQINEFVKDFTELLPAALPVPSFPPPKSKEPYLIIRTTHAALNHVDLLYARGLHQNNTSLVRPPFTLGLEFAGVVLDVSLTNGGNITGFEKGDRVFGSTLGAFATYVVVPVSAVRRVPHGWTLRQAASLPATLPVSYGALVRAGKVQKGETVLVHGVTGGLGCMAVQCARGLGAKVLGTVGSAYKQNVAVRELGFTEEEVVLYGDEGWEKKVREASGGVGVDVVIDAVGYVEGSLRCIKSSGRVVVLGYAGRGGRMEVLKVNRILLKDASVIGYRFGDRNRRIPGESEAIWRDCETMIRDRHVKPVIYDEQFQGLESVPRAMQEMEDRKIWGKAIIDILSEDEFKAKM